MPPIHMHSLLMLLNTLPTLERSWSPTLLILVSQTETVDITSLSLSNALFLAWMEMELKSPLKQPLRPKMISPVVPQMFMSKICFTYKQKILHMNLFTFFTVVAAFDISAIYSLNINDCVNALMPQ